MITFFSNALVLLLSFIVWEPNIAWSNKVNHYAPVLIIMTWLSTGWTNLWSILGFFLRRVIDSSHWQSEAIFLEWDWLELLSYFGRYTLLLFCMLTIRNQFLFRYGKKIFIFFIPWSFSKTVALKISNVLVL